MTAPLSRNRNYHVLWGSQALSEFGINASTIALPLLVLAMTGSPAATGLVLGTSAAAQLLVGLPAGALVDRWNHKKVMLCSEAAQAIAAASLVVALLWDVASVAYIVIVAAVMGVCTAMFEPAEDACLPNLMPAEQLSTAVAMNSARGHLAQLSGTAAGGFLFAVGRFVPFAVDVLTHTMAFFFLMFLRPPPRKVRLEPEGHLGREIAAGLRWVWRHRPVRVIALLAVALNLFLAAYFIIIIVLAQARGVPSGEIGIMAAMLGVGGILGALSAPYLHRRMGPYLSIITVFWALTVLTPLAVFISNGYLMGALFAGMAFLVPTANTTIETYLLLLTPDELRGRMSAVIGVVTGIAGTVGPALGGLLMEVFSGNYAVLLCAAGIGAVTLLATISPTLRKFPRYAAAEVPQATVRQQEQRVEP
ncbi:MAG: MFS transporter [Gemmatimonadota bacterium]|nr:MFS transporter [Gemmatimonadota bacterium]